ncbi:hypothetical protein HYH03_001344 [Edaphochlamys debaryana]|uniref:Uncharacterized protein n=1 Tax=Edaphochlamys debaryana TaxID=47281 RepID=A0A836C658_9CHLO|nr:hypothetical protein HYH03_001344 [Edaphochlamys debaryana]|eukprot:KAG2500574.1 hypothetical protein HYH03_001344 [Edaphochlamys debaryana]
MSVRVAYGQLETSSEGVATDTFWVTDFRGRKLKDSSASSLGARLEDFLIVCQATESDEKEWRCGNIEVSNLVSPDMTQVIIRGEPDGTKPGFLLELTTALTSVGASIQEAAIQGGTDVPEPACDIAEPGHDFVREGRVFKFMLKGPTGGQMDADRVASLIFTLRLLEGKGIMPTVAPNMDALLKLQTKCN